MNPPEPPKSPSLPSPLRGIIPPLMTPLRDPGALDVEGTARLIDHAIGGGVGGLFVLGTTGEAAHLSNALKREMIRETVRLTAGRVPVLVGVTEPSPADTLDMARAASDAGADAVVVSAPFYLPVTQGELLAFVKAVAAGQPLPVFCYNIPQLTKTGYELETVRRLLDEPRVVGFKDSAGDWPYLERAIGIAAERPDFSVLVGSEPLLARAMGCGAHGGVCGGANLDPAFFVRLAADAAAGRATERAEQRLLALHRLYVRSDISHSLKLLKHCLSLRNLCAATMAAPLAGLTEEQRVEAESRFDELFAEGAIS